MSSKLVIAWYTPADVVGRAIASVTKSQVSHVGAAIVQGDTTTYINVQPPRITLLDHIPAGAVFTKTYEVNDEAAVRGLRYMHELAGHAYAESIIGSDLVNLVFHTHVEVSADGDQVCSGTVDNLLVRMELDDSLEPDQATPGGLLEKIGHD